MPKPPPDGRDDVVSLRLKFKKRRFQKIDDSTETYKK
jgi:hypothetical protein